MALGRKTVNSLGALAAVGILAGAYFGVASPIIESNSKVEAELLQAQQIGASHTNKLSSFQGEGDDATRAATETMATFQSLVAGSIDIESASRAIASALPPGVKLESFDFGATQPVAAVQSAPLTITGFTAPAEFTGAAPVAETPAETSQEDAVADAGAEKENLAPEAAASVDPSAPISGFNRVPFTIEVTANSYGELSEYLNSLSQQPRLMSVVSIDSNRSETVSATIYAFAFSGNS